jgi:hypothetical protein
MRKIAPFVFLMVMGMLSPALGADGDKREDECKAKCEREMLEYQKRAGNKPPANSFAIDSCVDECKKGITMGGESDIVKLCQEACENVLLPMGLRNNAAEKKRCVENCVEVAARNLFNFLRQEKQPTKGVTPTPP